MLCNFTYFERSSSRVDVFIQNKTDIKSEILDWTDIANKYILIAFSQLRKQQQQNMQMHEGWKIARPNRLFRPGSDQFMVKMHVPYCTRITLTAAILHVPMTFWARIAAP